MSTVDFSSDLLSFYRMMEMADVYGSQMMSQFTVEKSLNSNASTTIVTRGIYEQLMNLILNVDSKGAYPIDALTPLVKELANGYSSQDGSTSQIDDEIKKTFRHALRLYSTNNRFDMFNDNDCFQNSYYDNASKQIKQINDLKAVLGSKFCQNLDIGDGTKKTLSVALCSTPILTPQMRNVSKVEFWLNNMPSYVLSRCTPYVDIKFQFERFAEESSNESGHNTTFGLLKFLEGANMTLDGANKAMFDANVYDAGDAEDPYGSTRKYHKRVGMEAFLTPQTLINPNSQGFQDRFVDVIDKFRPLATLKSFEIGIQPLIGFMTYKNGSITFTLHDRSRLHEIADMIRPQLFKGTTLWITYGWRHPVEVNNPYANFINENLLMREAFMVVNSEYAFDNVGQVEIKLQIASHGARTAEATNVIGKGNDVSKLLGRLQDISQRIAYAQQKLGLSQPQGIKDEVRAYELLDFASKGSFPDMDKNEMAKAIKKLDALISTGKYNSETQSIANDLKNDLKTLYTNNNNVGKFDELLKKSYERATAEKFNEVIEGPDPWLPNDIVDNKFMSILPKWMNRSKLINEYKNAENPETSFKNTSYKFRRRIVSFGKLFTVFVGDALSQIEEIDEVQIWFYKLNDHCGPASCINIAEFPIEVTAFIKKYNDYMYQRRAENISIKEFLSLLISSQFTDPRSLAFGLRSFYEPYDPKKPDPTAKAGSQKNFESAIAQRQADYGTFVYPAIQIMFETVHARTDTTRAPIDLLQLLEYIDAPLTTKFDNKNQIKHGSYKRIMRVHCYDKTLNAYPLESMLLRDKNGGIIEVPPTTEGKALFEKLLDIQRRYPAGSKESVSAAQKLVEATIGLNGKPGSLTVKAHDVQPATNSRSSLIELNDEISKRVPTIHYGSNGTTITSAQLSSKADARVSTINMIKPQGGPNSLQPNGSGFGGLPVRIIPATMTMTSLGMPLANPAQLYYVDMKTGTTADGLMILTNINHTFGPGKFETQWTFAYSDSYARYESIQTIASDFSKITGI